MDGKRTIYIGYDPREVAAYVVAMHSIKRRLTQPVPVRPIILDDMRAAGLYTRQTEIRHGRLWDVISEAPMSTEFAISRFLTPLLAGGGWSLFVDCDVMARSNIIRMFDQHCDRSKAVYVVKHDHRPTSETKMDGQIQTRYNRKNWSSVMLFNCDHPAHRALTPELINTVPGRDLHRFCWLEDEQIGELPVNWNYLVGHTELPEEAFARLVHFTDGIPLMPGYEHCEFADLFRHELHGALGA